MAFFGRSNVGKSSLLNRLAGRRGLARVSRTPGRTRTVNFFEIEGSHRLVDLPGYGFARAPDSVRAGWEDLVFGVLGGRSLALGLLLVDARRDPLPSDTRVLGLLRDTARPVAVVATKADKLKRGQAAARMRELASAFGDGGLVPVIACSARGGDRAGIGRIRGLIAREVRGWR